MGKGLPTHNQFIPLGVGLETELADKLVQPGSVVVLENALPRNTGEVIGRQGYDTLSTASQATRPSGGVLPHVHRLATLNGGLVRYNVAPVPIHVWDGEGEQYVAPSTTTTTSYRTGPISVSSDPVFEEVPGTDNTEVCDVIVIGQRRITAFEYTSGANTAVHLVVQDIATNTRVFSKTYTTNTFRPRLWAGSDSFALVYNNTGVLNIDVFDADTFTFGHTAGNTCEADSFIDIRTGGFDVDTDFSILYQQLTAPGYDGIRCTEFELAAGVVDDYLITTATAPVSGLADADLALTWLQDGPNTGTVAVIAASTAFGLYVLWDVQAPVAGSASATLHILDSGASATPSGSTPGIRNVVGTITLGSLYRVLYEMVAPDLPSLAVIKQASWTGSATLTTPYRSVGLRSQLWKVNSGAAGNDYFFLACQPADEQKTYFVMHLTGGNNALGFYCTPQGTAFVRSAGGLTGKSSHLSQVAVGPDGEFIIAVTHEIRTESTAPAGTATGVDSPILAVDSVSVLHRSTPDTELGVPVEFAGQLFSPGGTLLGFDGQTYGLPGFAAYPPAPGCVIGGTGNLTPDSDYVWVCLYSRIDRQGRKWRSAPSLPTANSTAGSDNKATLTADTLRVVDAESYMVEFYRSQADAPGAYFLVASVLNDPTQDNITLVDNVADTDLGEELYTDGGGLENQLTPAASHVMQFQNRLFMAESGTGTLWYSLDLDLNHGLLFNEALTYDVGNPTEPITGLAVSGSTLVVFKADKVYAVYGEGADALGRGQTYVDRLIEPAVGTTNATSILQTSDGVFFQSTSKRAGMHVVSPNLQVQYIGQGVREYNNHIVTAAVIVRKKSQYRFYTDLGRTFVYHTATKTWSTDTGQQCLHATGTYSDSEGVVFAHATGFEVLNEGDYQVTDGPYEYKPKMRSPWLQIAGMKGWERILNIVGSGTSGGAHKLTMRLYKDYDDTTPFAVYERQFDGSEAAWDWQQRPKIQKVSALMVELEIGPYTIGEFPVTTTGPGILGFTIIVGVKAGTKKQWARMSPVT